MSRFCGLCTPRGIAWGPLDSPRPVILLFLAAFLLNYQKPRPAPLSYPFSLPVGGVVGAPTAGFLLCECLVADPKGAEFRTSSRRVRISPPPRFFVISGRRQACVALHSCTNFRRRP